jgi:predicted transcriptional regulator
MTAAAVRPVAIKIDEDTKARVKRLADARHRTSHWLMREAITQYVDREEKREAFRQDTLKAWEEYRTTGLHVTADEADAWLASSNRATTSNLRHVTSDLVATGAA